MKVNQVADIVNEMSKQFLGAEAPTASLDVSSIIDVGRQALNATDVDNYVRKLVDHIGRVKFVNRPYASRAPSVLMEGWEFASVMEKIDMGIPDAEDNPSWKLQDGQTYDPNKFTAPKDITVKFYNSKDSFQIPMSFTEEQVKSAFSSYDQLNAFLSMIETAIQTSITIKLDGLIMSTINNFMANVYNGGKAINLLAEYKSLNPDSTLTAKQAIFDINFIKYAAYTIMLTSNRLGVANKTFNLGGRVRHTPQNRQKIIMLDVFSKAANVYLQSDTFHNELTKLPEADEVSFWQYSGDNFNFEDVSSINIIPATASGTGSETKISGIIGCIFDREALGVLNKNSRVTKNYNGLAEFINSWYKEDAEYFNDFNENFVMFYVAD